jgi:hypothetical protein
MPGSSGPGGYCAQQLYYVTSPGCYPTDHPVSAVYPIGQLRPTANSFIFVASIRSAKASGLPRR